MKLYITNCKTCQSKIYIDATASTRSDLRSRFGGDHFYAVCQNCQSKNLYHVTEVFAESEKTSALTGGVVGGLIGLIGGPLGLLVGSGLGAAIGNSIDDDEQKKVDSFNTSR